MPAKLGKEEGKNCWHDWGSGLEKFAKIKIGLEGAFKAGLALALPKRPHIKGANLAGLTLSQHCPRNGAQLSLKMEQRR